MAAGPGVGSGVGSRGRKRVRSDSSSNSDIPAFPLDFPQKGAYLSSMAATRKRARNGKRGKLEPQLTFSLRSPSSGHRIGRPKKEGRRYCPLHARAIGCAVPRPRDPAPARRATGPAFEEALSGAVARLRRRTRPLRLPPEPLLGPGQPHAPDRRGQRPPRALQWHERPHHPHRQGPQSPLEPQGQGLRRSLPRSHPQDPARGQARPAVRPVQPPQARLPRQGVSSTSTAPLRGSTAGRGSPPSSSHVVTHLPSRPRAPGSSAWDGGDTA